MFLNSTKRKTYIDSKNKFKTNTIKIINIVITTMFNFENTILYKTYTFKIIIMNEIFRKIEFDF